MKLQKLAIFFHTSILSFQKWAEDIYRHIFDRYPTDRWKSPLNYEAKCEIIGEIWHLKRFIFLKCNYKNQPSLKIANAFHYLQDGYFGESQYDLDGYIRDYGGLWYSDILNYILNSPFFPALLRPNWQIKVIYI